jgi:hypothetical protein
MRNKTYLAMRVTKSPYNLQLFAEGGDGTGAQGSNGDGTARGRHSSDDKEEKEPLTFEEFLKGDGNQAEFDRRVQKAIKTAVTKKQQKWRALTDNKLSEAEKLSKMSEDEREEYKRKKERQEFEAEKAEFEKVKLFMAVKEDLQKQNLPIVFAEYIAFINDAGERKDAIAGIKETWDIEIQEAIKAKARHVVYLPDNITKAPLLHGTLELNYRF